jgi:hypothetical protein
MTEQMVTNIGRATVEPKKEVVIQYGTKVTGSPQAMIALRADFREVAPRDGSKTLTERVNEAYGDELESEERELLDHAAEQFGRRLANEE